MQKLTRSLFALGAVVGLAACGDDVTVTPPTPAPAATVTGVVVSPAATTIKINEDVVFSAALQTTGTVTNTAVTWSSANAGIASVDGTGKVHGVAAGTTTIRATSAANTSASGAGAVTVLAPAVQSVSVLPASVSLAVGQSVNPTAAVTGDAAKTVSWASSAPAVASVTVSGTVVTVTAVASGTAVITATSTVDPTKAGSMTVNVGSNLTGLSVSPASASLTVNQTVQIVPTATTVGSPTVTYAYGTSASGVASVSNSGLVTAVAPGTAVITTTATTTTGATVATLTATTTITVSAIPNNLLSLTVSPSTINIGPGGSQQLTPTVNTVGGATYTTTYTSSDASIASVTTGGVVTGVATGTTVITVTVTSSTNSLSAAVTVTVANNLLSLAVAPTTINIGPSGTQQITAIASTVGSPTVTYTYVSSNTAVASVDGAGLVTGVGSGSAVITVTATTNTNSVSATVTVNVAAASVSISSLTTCTGGPPCAVVPVNLAGVLGQIEATLNLTSGSQQIDSVTVSIGGTQAASQVFGVNGAPTAPVTLSINTAAFNPTTYAPFWTNGQQTLQAKIWPHGATGPTASNTVLFTLVNPDVVYFNTTGQTHTGTSAVGLTGTWWAGGFTVGSHPVNYSGAIASITYAVGACGAATGTTGPDFVATYSCAGVEAAANDAVQAITVTYPVTYTLTVPPTLFMTAASAGFVPGSPVWTASNYSSNEDNVGPSLSAVSYTGVNIAGWHGTPVTYSATATDGGVGMTSSSLSAATTVDFTTDGGSSYAYINITAATQLPQTIIPASYQGAAAQAADLLGNLSASHGGLGGVFGVDLVVTDAQYSNRATSALAGNFPLASNATIYTAATWLVQEAAAQVVGVDAIDVNGSGLDNATALTQSIMRNAPGISSTCGVVGTSMLTILGDNYAQTTAPPEIDCGLAAGSRVGRYSWTSYVSDRAGNTLKPYQGSVSSVTPLDSVYIVIDELAPNITGIGFQTALYTGGQNASFSFSANDDYEIRDGRVTLTYAGTVPASTWVNPVPTVTYSYGATAFTVGSFSASAYDNTFVNVLNGQTLTLSYLLGALDATPAAGTTAAFVSSSIISNAAANVRDWAGQTGGGISAPILSTQVAAASSYAWATTSASGASIASNMTAFQITAKTAGTSVTVQQTGASSTSLFACSRIDIFEANALAVAGSVDAVTTTALTYVGTASFSSVNFTDNGINRFYNYGAIPVATTGGSGLYTAACVMGGRALFSPIL